MLLLFLLHFTFDGLVLRDFQGASWLPFAHVGRPAIQILLNININKGLFQPLDERFRGVVGYHICFTRRRSPVRIRTKTLFLPPSLPEINKSCFFSSSPRPLVFVPTMCFVFTSSTNIAGYQVYNNNLYAISSLRV